MTIALRIAAYIAVSYLVIVFVAWLMQDRLAFPSPRHVLGTPEGGERVAIRTHDGLTLSGWFLPPARPTSRPAPAVIWFTGNMETVGAMAPMLLQMRLPGAALLAVDYRGYGENPGKPTEADVYRDAEAIWDWLAARPDVDAMRIAVYGRSIGGVSATWLAAHRTPAAVVLDAPFTNARDMARRHYWFLPRIMTRLDLDNLERLRSVDVPVLILHGTQDRIAPFWMGQRLADAARQATLVPIEGAGHNETYDDAGPMYRDTVHAFLAKAFATDAP
ncbi:MAG: alpha/beta hydrolase [Gemmatimonadales bacterium]